MAHHRIIIETYAAGHRQIAAQVVDGPAWAMGQWDLALTKDRATDGLTRFLKSERRGDTFDFIRVHAQETT